MKTFAFILLGCLLITGTVFAADYPVDKGSTMISGMFGFTNSSGKLYEDYEGNSQTTVTFTPSVLAFVVPNFALGGNLAFAHASQGDVSARALAIGPKLGYFVGYRDSKAYPFFGVGFNYLRQTLEWVEYGWRGTPDTYEFTVSGTKFMFGAGVAVMVSSHLAMVCEGTYNLDNLKPEHGKSTSGSVFAIGVGLAGFVF